MTLRERLIALAAGSEYDACEGIALSAARMALEDADKLCREKAQHDYLESKVAKRAGSQQEMVRRIVMGNRCDDCADDIRYLLHDGLV